MQRKKKWGGGEEEEFAKGIKKETNKNPPIPKTLE